MCLTANNNIDWSEFDKRRKLAILSFWGLPLGMGLAVIGGGTGHYILIIPGIILIFAFMGFVNHLQECKCPNCGQPFTTQNNPIVDRWASVKVVTAKKCTSCGIQR